MTRTELEAYLTSHFGAESDHPFKEDPTITVFARPDNKKWFAATKNIGCRFLEIEREGRIDILNVKLPPRVVAKLRTRAGFRPAWHMNQNNWVTVLLDGSAPDEEIYDCLEQAFADAGGKAKRR